MDVTADHLDLLRTRTSEKWRAHPDDVLPLFVAETDYPLAPEIADALHAAIDRSDTGYVGSPEDLAPAFSEFAVSRWGWQVDPEQITTTTDVSVVIVESLRAVIQPGDGVIITPPVYPPFFDLIPEAGGRVVEVPLIEGETYWGLDLEGIENALSAGATAVLLCNPHNPLGWTHSRDELAALANLAAEFDATVVSDEIHAPLTLSDGAFTPFLSVSDAAREYGIAAHSASKAFNLAGLKCAMFVTAGERMHALVGSLPDEVVGRTGLFGRIASAAAFGSAGAWLDAALATMERSRDLLGSTLASSLPEVGFRMPRASYLAWLDFRALDWGDDPAAVALEHARVALTPGIAFGEQGRGFARLNFACSADVLTEAVERLAAFAYGRD